MLVTITVTSKRKKLKTKISLGAILGGKGIGFIFEDKFT